MHPIQKHLENSRIRRHSGAASFPTVVLPKAATFSSHAPSPFCQPGCTNSPTANRDGTTKNHVQCLMLSCYPNSFQIQKLTLSCKRFWFLTVPDTVHDSCGLRGEVGACRLPFSRTSALSKFWSSHISLNVPRRQVVVLKCEYNLLNVIINIYI